MISNKKKAVIHIAKAQVGMTGDEYRDLLASVGVESSKDLTNQTFEEVMLRFEELGYVSKVRTKKQPRKISNLPLGKKALMSKLEAILLDMDLPWKYVDSIAKNRFKKDSVQWLDPEELRKVVQMMIIHQKRKKRRGS